MLTLTPAYGRDYKSAMAAKLDLAANKDFIIADRSNYWCGKPINLSQMRADGYARVCIRYAGLRKTVSVDTLRNIE